MYCYISWILCQQCKQTTPELPSFIRSCSTSCFDQWFMSFSSIQLFIESLNETYSVHQKLKKKKYVFIEVLDEAALKRRPNRNGRSILPDKIRLWDAVITRAKYKRHNMPYHGKPTTLTALVLDNIYQFKFHAGWDMQQGWGKQLCFLFGLWHFLSYQVRRGAFHLARTTVDIQSSHPFDGRCDMMWNYRSLPAWCTSSRYRTHWAWCV